MATAIPALHLESALKQQAPAPLYLIVGEEDLLRDAALAAIQSAVLGDGGEFNYDLFYGDEATGADILASASEMPVFAERRLVVVKVADKLPSREGDVLLDYFKQPVETTTLVFMSAKLDGRLKFSHALARAAVMVDCAPLREAQVASWVARAAERLGLRLSDQAAQVLKEVAGESLYGARQELEKLASYVPPGRAVMAADVHLLRGIEPGASVFDLTLAIAESHRGKALSILARNLEAGEAPLRVLGSLAWQYRRLWKMKELLAMGGRDREVARTLRMDPVKVRSFLARFSEEHLQTALRMFLDADAHLKGGSSGHPRMVMERLLLRLCDLVKRPAPGGPERPPAVAGKVAMRALSNVRTIKSGNGSGR